MGFILSSSMADWLKDLESLRRSAPPVGIQVDAFTSTRECIYDFSASSRQYEKQFLLNKHNQRDQSKSEQKQGQDRKVSENATQVRPTAAHYSDSSRPTKRHFSQLLLYDSADNCDSSFSADFYFIERETVENTRNK